MSDRRSLKPWLVCVALALGAAALIGTKDWSRRGYVAAWQAHDVAFFEQQARWRASLEPLLADLRMMERDRAPDADVWERVKAYNPAVVGGTAWRGERYGQLQFVEPQTGAKVDIAFKDERLAYFSYEMASTLPFDRTRWEAHGRAIRWAAGMALAAWAVVLFRTVNAWTRRRTFAPAMIGLAIFAGVAWSLDRRLDGVWRVQAQSLTFLASALALIASVALLAWPQRQPLDPSRCRKCHYDLTGNLSGRCPECGTAVNANADALGKSGG